VTGNVIGGLCNACGGWGGFCLRDSWKKALYTHFLKMMNGEKRLLVFVFLRRSKNNNPVSGRIFDLKSSRLFLEKDLLHTFFEDDAWRKPIFFVYRPAEIKKQQSSSWTHL